MADVENRKAGTAAQRDFKYAEDANIVQRAGEGLDAARNARPTPANRLSTKEVLAEAGKGPDESDRRARRDAGRQVDAEAKAEEREALRRQRPAETDTDLQRPEGSTALEDPVITANPD